MDFLSNIDWSLWGPVLSIFVLICLSGFFSGSETSLTAVSKARMISMEKDGDERATTVIGLIDQKDKLIGALLLGNNLVNILASSIATALLIRLVGEAGVVYATLVMTVVVLIFAEVLPKTYALANSDRMALMISPVIRVVVLVLSPITNLITKIVGVTLRVLRLSNPDEDLSDIATQELRGAIELAHETIGEETLAKDVSEKRAMLRSILDLMDVTIEDVMTHRSSVVALDADLPVQTILDETLQSPYTRVPVWRDNPDNIIGVIHAKILLRELRSVSGNVDQLDIETMLMPAWFVPETTTLFDQLQAFRERREHFAIVVDEYGSFQGIVTLEDVLEEIVGEIDDEQDSIMQGIKILDDGYAIDGTVTIRDINRELDWSLPDDHYTTIAGLVIHESKMVPEEGQIFIFYNCRFTVLKRERNQILKLLVSPLKEADDTVS